MGLSSGKHDNSGLIHWVQFIHRSRSKTDKINVLERKIQYKMMAIARQVSKPHVPAGCMKGWWLYEPQDFCFSLANTGWQEPQLSHRSTVNHRGVCQGQLCEEDNTVSTNPSSQKTELGTSSFYGEPQLTSFVRVHSIIFSYISHGSKENNTIYLQG